MDDFKTEVKMWLDKIGKSRDWLGNMVRNIRTPEKPTPKRTVDRWLSPSSEPVPAWAELEIRKLMGTSQQKNLAHKLEELPNQESLGKMFITLPPEIQDMVYEEALRQGLSVSAYCSLAVEYAATNKDMRNTILEMHMGKREDNAKSPAAGPNVIAPMDSLSMPNFSISEKRDVRHITGRGSAETGAGA